jgi:hypothetical protein
MDNNELPSNYLLGNKRKVSDSKGTSISEPSNNVNKKLNKKPNRKKILKNKIEFLLSNINLMHDIFLRTLYFKKQNYGIPPEIFLKCNSIRALLSDIEKTENRKDILLKAVSISSKIYYEKNLNLIKRKYDFDITKINQDYVDKSTVFIQNLPSNITHELIYEIFDKYKIEYISLLKNKKNKVKNNKKETNNKIINCLVSKDQFRDCFITFKTKEEAEDCIKNYNNVFPVLKNLIYKSNVNLIPLNIISKKDWEERYNQKPTESQNMKMNPPQNNCDENCLVKIHNLKPNINLFKFKNLLNTYCKCLFVDLDRT